MSNYAPTIEINNELVPTAIDGDDREFVTNIPEGIELYNPEGRIPHTELIPGAVDQLPGAGNYVLQTVDQNEPSDIDFTSAPPINNETKIIQNENGRFIDIESLEKVPLVTPNMSVLMDKMGYLFEERINSYNDEPFQALVAIPSPETIKKSCAEMGVEIELFNGMGLISPHEYVQSYSEGKYPVATGNETYYAHDIQDDHLTGVILGGVELRDALAEVSKGVLETENDEAIGDLAGRIDTFTTVLRSVVAPSISTAGEAYGERLGRRTLYQEGERLGFSHDTVEVILSTAQKNATDLGIEITHLQ